MAAEEATTAPAAEQPVSAQVVGNAFVQQYYHILHQSPELVYRFYQDVSKLGRPEDDGSMSITTTMQAINDKILSLKYEDFGVEIKSVDAQESFNGGVQVLVTGYVTSKDSATRNFAQTFFLAPQDRGYFVLNDVFRYVENANQQERNYDPANEVVEPNTPEQNVPPVQEENTSIENVPSHEEVTSPEEANDAGEVFNPPENGDVPIVHEEVSKEDVAQDEPHKVTETNINSEEAPKKSYASIVMHLKESAATFTPPKPAPRKHVPKPAEVAPPVGNDGLVSSSETPDNESNHEGEAADGCSIYIKGLPMNATPFMLAEEFKQFGAIKSGGIQVRSNRGFCFGFVEFEEPISAQKAIEASPITIGGRQAVVEEKKSTNSRVNNRGRFQPGRGTGFRNDGGRGRGNYGGGRGGYGRGDFNGRADFGYNRGGNRGGSSNRGDGYQRVEGNGGRLNRSGGMTNGPARNGVQHVSATA